MQNHRPHHYRHLLKAVFAQRNEKNRQFTLRCFAKKLQVSPAQLSRVLSGKRKISAESSRLIAKHLFISEHEARCFVDLVELGNRSLGPEEEKMEKLLFLQIVGPETPVLDETRVRCFMRWSVPATFDILGLRNPPTTVAGLSLLLGESEEEALRCLQLLEHAKLIRKQGEWYERIVSHFRTQGEVPSSLVRDMHKQFMARAIRALEQQSIPKRYFRSKTLTIKPEFIPVIREKLHAFCQELEKYERMSEGEGEEIYQLNLQFFDLLFREENSIPEKGKTHAS